MSSTNENRGAVHRYPLPGVPTPLLDADIANKAYVDSISAQRALIGDGTIAVGAGETRFQPMFGNTSIATESLIQISFPRAITITRFICKPSGNSASGGNTTMVIRDDGVNVPNTTLTFPLSDASEQDSGAISESIAAGSLLNLQTIVAAGGTFTIGAWSMEFIYT